MSLHPQQDNIEYCAKRYTKSQVELHAKACKEGGCPSYIHCFYGQNRTDGSVPMPVCAYNILLEMEKK